MPYDYPNTGNNSENVDPNAKGQSADNPYTVQEAVQLIKDGKAPTSEVYVKGIVSKLDYYNANYKSLSYYFSDDGKAEDMQVFSGKGLNGADFNNESELKVGQTVVVKGVIKSFDKNGTTIYEIDKNSQIVSIEGEGTQEQPGDEKGQSKENPYTVKEAVNLIKEGKAPTFEVYVKGVVSKVDYYSEEYHSLSYYLSDDGKTETYKFDLIEYLNVNVQKFVHGDSAVTGTSVTGGVSIASGDDELTEKVVVFEQVMRGGVPHRIVVPRAKITEIGDIPYKRNEAVKFPITITAIADASGKKSYEYYGGTSGT